jgi:hypothetical protein
MTIKPNRVRIDPYDAVKCPSCDLTNLHHVSVELFQRNAEDATEGIHVLLDRYGLFDVDDSMRGNPSPRRNGLYIRFICETCDAKPVLKMLQHKGSTYMEWL